MPSQFIKGRVSDVQGRPLAHDLRLNVTEIPAGLAADRILVFGVDGNVRYLTQTQLVAAAVAAVPAVEDDGSGGTDSPLTTKGDIWGYSTVDDRIPVGADGDVLVADSGDPLGVSWQAPSAGSLFDILSANNRLTVSQPDLAASDVTLTVVEANIDHDALANFVADEHVAHSGVTLTAGVGLAGGGTIAANRTFDLDITELTEDTAPDEAADFLVTYDTSASAHKKVKPDNIQPFVTNATGTLPINRGGTGQVTQTAAMDALSPTSAKGSLLVDDGTNVVAQTVGTNGYVLTAASGETNGVKWAPVGAGGSNTWTTIVKPADEVIQSTVDVFDDDTLFFSTTANTNYVVRLVVMAQSNSATDFSYLIHHTGTTTRMITSHRQHIVGATTVASQGVREAEVELNVALGANNTEIVIWVDVILQVGASGGVFSFQWAQQTTGASDTTVYEGSYLEYMVS